MHDTLISIHSRGWPAEHSTGERCVPIQNQPTNKQTNKAAHQVALISHWKFML